MQELSLEKEFELYKQIHKATILQAKMTTYYENLQNTGITIPDFMQTPPCKLAEKAVLDLICYSPKMFEKLYNKAWDEVAEVLP